MEVSQVASSEGDALTQVLAGQTGSEPTVASQPTVAMVEKSRFDGLMSAFNRAKAQAETIAKQTVAEKEARLKAEAEAKAAQETLHGVQTQSEAVLGEATRTLEQMQALFNERDAEAKRLAGENARLQVLAQNPDVADFADLIPATSSIEELNAKIASVRAAVQKRSGQASEATRQQIAATAVNPSNPGRVATSNEPDAAAFDRRLKAAMADGTFEREMQAIVNEQNQWAQRTRAAR